MPLSACHIEAHHIIVTDVLHSNNIAYCCIFLKGLLTAISHREQ